MTKVPISAAKSAILARLDAAPRQAPPTRPAWAPPTYGDTKAERFAALLTAAHAEVHGVTEADWPQRLAEILAARGVRSLLFGPATEAGSRLAEAWAGLEDAPRLVAYDCDIEACKGVLVEGVEAGFTTTLGGIAETGSLVLWPTPAEPRLMSLLPPIHVALVRAATLTDSLAAMMAEQGWAGGLPTNALLISGPSKSADIEQTLVYGVHGPKELIVILIG